MRLIDADAIPWTDLNADMQNSKIKVLVTFAEKVNRMPTVDAVPVVRCKDCKWYGYYSCEMGGNDWMRDGNGFCDRGERRDGKDEA